MMIKNSRIVAAGDCEINNHDRPAGMALSVYGRRARSCAWASTGSGLRVRLDATATLAVGDTLERAAGALRLGRPPADSESS